MIKSTFSHWFPPFIVSSISMLHVINLFSYIGVFSASFITHRKYEHEITLNYGQDLYRDCLLSHSFLIFYFHENIVNIFRVYRLNQGLLAVHALLINTSLSQFTISIFILTISLQHFHSQSTFIRVYNTSACLLYIVIRLPFIISILCKYFVKKLLSDDAVRYPHCKQ